MRRVFIHWGDIVLEVPSIDDFRMVRSCSPPSASDGHRGVAIAEQVVLLKASISAICQRHPMFRLLILARKFRLSAISHVLSRELTPGKNEARIIFMQASLIATNFILRYSPNPLDVQRVADRNFLKPSEAEIAHSLRLLILSSILTWKTFFLNTLVRLPLASGSQFDQLIELSNKRGSRETKTAVGRPDGSSTLMVLTPINALPIEPRMSVIGLSNTPLTLLLINYLPLPISADPWRHEFRYMDSSDFTRAFGITYSDAWTCWLGFEQARI